MSTSPLPRWSVWKLFADQAYLAKWLTEHCKQRGVELITKVRRNIKPVVHNAFDAAVLWGRSLVETVFDELKNLCQIEHTRHRSVANFAVNLLAGIAAYCLFPNKPKLPIQTVNYLRLTPN